MKIKVKKKINENKKIFLHRPIQIVAVHPVFLEPGLLAWADIKKENHYLVPFEAFIKPVK